MFAAVSISAPWVRCQVVKILSLPYLIQRMWIVSILVEGKNNFFGKRKLNESKFF